MQPQAIVRLATFIVTASVVAMVFAPGATGADRLSTKLPNAQAPSPPANPPAVLLPNTVPQRSVGKIPTSPAPFVPTPFPNIGSKGSSTNPPQSPSAQWNFEKAWPSKVSGPQPKSDSNEFGINDPTMGPKSLGPQGAKPASGNPEPEGRVKVKMPWLPEAPSDKMTAPEGPLPKVEVRGWDPKKKEEIKGSAEAADPPQAEMFNPTELSIKKSVPWDKPK